MRYKKLSEFGQKYQKAHWSEPNIKPQGLCLLKFSPEQRKNIIAHASLKPSEFGQTYQYTSTGPELQFELNNESLRPLRYRDIVRTLKIDNVC